jgi:hypothetical protein
MAILMFHERVAVIPAAKLNMSWRSDGVVAEDGTSRYTEMSKTNFMRNIFKCKYYLFYFIFGLTVLPGVVTANDGRRGSRSANHKCVGASAQSWLSGREGNEIQTKKEMVIVFSLSLE